MHLPASSLSQAAGMWVQGDADRGTKPFWPPGQEDAVGSVCEPQPISVLRASLEFSPCPPYPIKGKPLQVGQKMA